MTVKEILALTSAGFTKDDIMLIASAEKPNTNGQTLGATNGAPIQQTQSAPIQQTQSAPIQQTQTSVAPLMTDGQVKQLAQALNLGSASIDVPPTVTLDEKMSEHFKNLLLGKE